MPSSFDRVARLLPKVRAALREDCRAHLVLLVVPGLAWRAEQLKELGRWQRDGWILAGHGWLHEARETRRLYHRLHALVLSRRAAEHLALQEAEIVRLMRDAHAWFARQGLGPPDLYVPPAWALGRISRRRLAEAPFDYVEVTTGFLDLRGGRARRLPLVGFEADTRFRQAALTVNNLFNQMLASPARPLRIAIHPEDPERYLGAQLERLLGKVTRSRHYAELFPPPATGG